MQKKIFTLIYGDEIKVAPEQKIIPAASFSALQTAEEVLETIKKDAEKYREDVTKELELVKEQAFQEGYAEGFREWSERLAKFEQELETMRADLQKKIVPTAVLAAKKIVGREIELSEKTVVDIVLASLKAVAQHKKITIYVNKKDLDILDRNKPRLREVFENLESLSVRPREDVLPGGCVIETEIGIINAQYEHRWLTLEKAFENLMKTSPDAFK